VVEEDLLVLGQFGNAAGADVDPGFRGQHDIHELVPDGTDTQIALMNPERRLRFGQLDVGFPQVFIAPGMNVAAGGDHIPH